MTSKSFKNLIIILPTVFCFGCATAHGQVNKEATTSNMKTAAYEAARIAADLYSDCLIDALSKIPIEATAKMATKEMVRGAASACGVPADSMRDAYVRYGASMVSDGIELANLRKYGTDQAEKQISETQELLIKMIDDSRNSK